MNMPASSSNSTTPKTLGEFNERLIAAGIERFDGDTYRAASADPNRRALMINAWRRLPHDRNAKTFISRLRSVHLAPAPPADAAPPLQNQPERAASASSAADQRMGDPEPHHSQRDSRNSSRHEGNQNHHDYRPRSEKPEHPREASAAQGLANDQVPEDAEEEWQPAPHDGLQRTYEPEMKVHGRDALTIRATKQVKKKGDREVVRYTIMIEAASPTGVGRTYDWANKVTVMAMAGELKRIAATLMGYRGSETFEAKHHGPNKDKGFSIQHQGDKVFFRIFAKGRNHAVPVPVEEVFDWAILCQRQIHYNVIHSMQYPECSANLISETLACTMKLRSAVQQQNGRGQQHGGQQHQ
jgi:hypothetical protein